MVGAQLIVSVELEPGYELPADAIPGAAEAVSRHLLAIAGVRSAFVDAEQHPASDELPDEA